MNKRAEKIRFGWSLVLSDELVQEFKERAAARKMTANRYVQQIIKAGLLVDEISARSDAHLILCQDGKEDQEFEFGEGNE